MVNFLYLQLKDTFHQVTIFRTLKIPGIKCHLEISEIKPLIFSITRLSTNYKRVNLFQYR